MENASSALLIVGMVLVGILILTLMAILFTSAGKVTQEHTKEISQTRISEFNANLIKYMGVELSAHQAKSIFNFADANNISVNIKSEDIDLINEKKYKLNILEYTEEGYIKSISLTNLP